MIDPAWRHWSAACRPPQPLGPRLAAPPAVQDATAAASRQAILDHHHDVAAVPVAWYLPAALTQPTLMDRVPAPRPATPSPPASTSTRWLTTYHQHNHQHRSRRAGQCTRRRPTANGRCPSPHRPRRRPRRPRRPPPRLPRLGLAHPRRHAHLRHPRRRPSPAPPPGPATAAATRATCRRHSAASASPSSTPTATAGPTATAPPSPSPSATPSPPANRSHWSGNTGHSSGPHLHLEIRTDGTRRCPQPLLTALHQPHGPTPTTLPTTGCTF